MGGLAGIWTADMEWTWVCQAVLPAIIEPDPLFAPEVTVGNLSPSCKTPNIPAPSTNS